MKKLFYCFAVLISLFTGLKSMAQTQPEEVTAKDVPSALKMMNGSWTWTESRRASRGVKPTVQTPKSTGQKLTVTFKPDMTVQVFENGKLAGTFTYALTQRDGDYLMISYKSSNDNSSASRYLEEGPVMVSASQLHISGGYNDAGQNQTFKKITTTKTKTAVKKKKAVKKTPAKKATVPAATKN